jgi:hypothetical protein
MSGVVLAALAGAARGQLTEACASGLRHTSIGGASLGPVDGRRLPVHNLGSSGEDGVEIQLRTLWGGGVGVPLAPLGGGGGGAGGMLRTKYKGWDGTIKGRFELVSNPGGGFTQIADFSDLGATAVRVMECDSQGVVISDELYPGPIYAKPIVPDCPPPSVPTMWYWRLWDSNLQKYVYQWMWTCMDHVTLNGDHLQDEMRIIPVLPVGVEDGDLDTMMLTSTAPEIDVIDGQMLAFGESVHGIGDGTLEEECAGGVPCARADRVVRCGNIGSSGQDGVSVGLGPRSAGGSVSYRRSVGGWDLKENTKAYDDQGAVMMRVGQAVSPLTGEASALEFDFSGIGDGTVEATFYGAGGTPLGSALYIPNVGGTVVLDPSWLCPPPSYPVYAFNYVTQKWIFLTCSGGFDLVLPSGETIGPVTSVELSPNSSGLHRLRSVEVTGSDAGGDIVVTGVTEEGCPAEVSGDGVVDLTDFFQFLGDFDTTSMGADVDGSGEVDLGDFFVFLNSFDAGC